MAGYYAPKPSKDKISVMIYRKLISAILLSTSVVTLCVSNETLVLRCGVYELGFNLVNGSIQFIRTPKGILCRTPEDGSLWQIRFVDGSTLSANQFSADNPQRRFSIQRAKKKDTVTLLYESTEAVVEVQVQTADKGVDFRLTVRKPSKVVLDITLPDKLVFFAQDVRRFYFPKELGLAFKREFFLPQSTEQPLAWTYSPVGADGWQFVSGSKCVMRPVDDAPVKVKVTPEGISWLGEDFAKQLEGVDFVVNRPAETYDVTLVTSPNGAFITCHRDGNARGWLIRFGGIVKKERAQLALELIVRAARYLWQKYDKKRQTIAVIELDRGSGARMV